jgi:NAD-dependent SIR2 family protein deacetylase
VTSDRTLRGIRQAAELIGQADALLITAGAGMGVDSGLPDFRGKDGFWRAYPALGKRGISFERMAQPAWFRDEPETAWAFYGHRQQLYRETVPHAGFGMLLEWGRIMPGEYFVVTSNVDGQFETAGFAAERMLEVHGNVQVYQCAQACRQTTWRDSERQFDVDLETMRARGRLPTCPHCGGMARPNVLMFGDGRWVPRVTHAQQGHYQHWLASVRGRRLVVMEVGAGKAIPTMRRMGEDLVAQGIATLVRINPEASEADEGVIPIRMGALEALTRIEELARAKIASRSTVLSGARPASRAMARGPERLPKPVPAAEMEVVDFFEASAERPATPLWQRVLSRHSDLRNATFLDLVSGQVEPFNYLGITVEEEQAVLDCWNARGFWKYPPVPAIAGHVAPGFLVTGHTVLAPGSDAPRKDGAVILHICNEEKEWILTMGVARRPLEGAYLWRMLYEDANTFLTPLDVPQVPWIARRLDKAASRYTAMLPALQEIGRAMAWTWLRVQAHNEQRGNGEGE